MEVNGLRPAEETESKLKIQVCFKCRASNGVDMQFCGQCGSALSIEIALEQQQDMKNVGYALAEAIKTGDLNTAIEGLSQLILKADYEKKRKR